MLDSDTIDWEILCVLESFSHVHQKDNVVAIRRNLHAEQLLQADIIKALVDLNIIHISKYYDYMHVEHRLYFKVIKDFVA